MAYVRHFGAYHPHDIILFQHLFEKLFKWAIPRGFVQFPQTKAFTVYGGHPDLSPPEQLKVDVCITVPQGTRGDGEIGIRTISGGQYVVIHMESSMKEAEEAWDIVFREWLPNSGFQPDDRNYYLNHLNDPKTHPNNSHIVDMCLPVKPL